MLDKLFWIHNLNLKYIIHSFGTWFFFSCFFHLHTIFTNSNFQQLESDLRGRYKSQEVEPFAFLQFLRNPHCIRFL